MNDNNRKYELKLDDNWMYDRFMEIGVVYENWFHHEDGAPAHEDGYEFIPEFMMEEIVELMQHNCREKLFFDLLVANFFLCQNMFLLKEENQVNVFDYLGGGTFSKAIGLSNDESNLVADLSGFEDTLEKMSRNA